MIDAGIVSRIANNGASHDFSARHHDHHCDSIPATVATTLNRQGNDVGTQYRSAIFPQTREQQATAERVKARVEASGKWKRPITTTIEPASPWYSAEGYHQDYLRKNPGGYTCHFMRD